YAMVSQRQAEFALLASKVDRQLDDPVVPEPPATSKALITAVTNLASDRTLAAALAWIVTGKEEHFADARMRALNLASWDPQGSTSYANDDEVSRRIATTLTLAYDWLFTRLDADQRSLLLAAILARGIDMYNDVIGGGRARIAVYPQDSHGSHTLTHLAAICVLLAGDIPECWGGLRDTLPLALHWTSPWGGEDGGFGNGTNYAHFVNGDSLLAWYILRWVVGVDIGRKAWARNYSRYLAYFVPPGAPAGAFGDGAELMTTEAWARYGKAHTLFSPTSLGRWRASQLAGEDPTRLELLLAPPADADPAPSFTGTPSAALFPSIGWAAMHSELSDPARVSVYFKSSFFASYNHSHADQNGFTLNAGGERLAIDSGYYDGYQTPHWWQWYKRTRAHNAITFDGGQGQVVFEEGSQYGPGTVSHFEHHPGYDIVTGDATQAYGGALTQAKRSMVYLRPNRVLVYDRLASDTPRQWEWNIHALDPMNVISDQKISIARNGQSLCVDMLAGPAMHFAQTDLFTAQPSSGAAQWHGTFSSIDLLGATEFIALLSVGCTPTGASASKTDGVWTVLVDGKTVTIGDSRVSVQ
ncbi:MAG: heparinase II/III domain-containing protein, partial [Alphaproteobacteria bacterium]